MKQIHICEGIVIGLGGRHRAQPCKYKAKALVDGKWFCKKHDRSNKSPTKGALRAAKKGTLEHAIEIIDNRILGFQKSINKLNAERENLTSKLPVNSRLAGSQVTPTPTTPNT